MAIKQTITFEGLKYNLDDKDRVAGAVALDNVSQVYGSLIASGSTGVANAASGQLFVTSSAVLKTTDSGQDDFLVLCVKK